MCKNLPLSYYKLSKINSFKKIKYQKKPKPNNLTKLQSQRRALPQDQSNHNLTRSINWIHTLFCCFSFRLMRRPGRGWTVAPLIMPLRHFYEYMKTLPWTRRQCKIYSKNKKMIMINKKMPKLWRKYHTNW